MWLLILRKFILRTSLQQLIDKTIIYKYSLPDSSKQVESIKLSNCKDDCYDYSNNSDLIEVIYNSIIEYSFNEFELDEKNYSTLLAQALQSKIKYKDYQQETTKIKYGFYGEVLLYSILYNFYKSKPIISRGYFYHPLENSETKGYDSYHLIENDENIELWFGEVKFRAKLYSGLKSAIDGLSKALSDEYLSKNILAMDNHRNNFSIKNTQIEIVLNSWRENPSIKIIDEIIKYNMTLVYPILLIYEDGNSNYDEKIQQTVNYINKTFSKTKYTLSINYKLFFIFLPINQVKKIKQEVIKWIESKKPPLS